MGIWIRSQDKRELINCKSFSIYDRIGKFSLEYFVYGTTNGEEKITRLGLYSSEEKALKVLDMIQKELNEEIEMNLEVFQMPQDDEI